MRQTYDALHATVARIRALCDETCLDPAVVLDAAALARTTALTAPDVQALLDGKELDDSDVDARVCARVRNLFDARVAESGRRPADIRQEIQAHLQISHEWARRLCNGIKAPNVRDLHGLREYFGVPNDWHFTDTAAAALNSALQPIARGLEFESGDLLATYIKDFDKAVIAHRGAPLTSHEVAVMTTYIAAVLHSPRGRT